MQCASAPDHVAVDRQGTQAIDPEWIELTILGVAHCDGESRRAVQRSIAAGRCFPYAASRIRAREDPRNKAARGERCDGTGLERIGSAHPRKEYPGVQPVG